MSGFAGKRPGTQDVAHHTPESHAAPGKQSLVEQVQRLAGAGAASGPSVQDAATAGVATPASAVPHAETIQRAFGRHDVSGVQAHTGPEAGASAQAMGAQAYATGNHIVLGGNADLHTVAHEAAHVVQQRGGVQLKGGVGEAGDRYERHADAVADAVVQGKSAEPILDTMAGGGAASPAAGHAVQHKLIGADDKQIPHGDISAFTAKHGDVAAKIKRLSTIATPIKIDSLDQLAAEIRTGKHDAALAEQPEGVAHPDWANGEALNGWADGLSSHDKMSTLHGVNAAKNQGHVPGQSVTYLGGDQDIEHPLFTTNDTNLTLVGIDPNTLTDPSTADHNRQEVLNKATAGIIAKLERYKKPGVAIASHTQLPVSTILVTDSQSGQPHLTIEYHAQTYDEFVGKAPPKADIVMDKDSWLKEWKDHNDHEAVQAMAQLTKAGGLWMGGFNSSQPLANDQIATLFHDVTDTVSPEHQRWSGYEELKVRKLRDQPVASASNSAPTDPVWEKIRRDVLPTVDDELKRTTMNDAEYQAMLGNLEYIVPYVAGIQDTHYTQLAAHIMAKISGMTAQPAGLNAAKVKQDLEALG
jgi:hypothetical protein